MGKLIFKKLFLDILIFFVITSVSISLIVWVIQAVNLLDIVSEDGHSLRVYFIYTVLNLPKIFSRTIIFVLFISIFYILIKYENSNEILVFWSNGIKKFYFIKLIVSFSILFLILQLILNLFVVPESQNLGRKYLKNSNIDFLPKLLKEKKFVDIANGLTIYIDRYKKNKDLDKVYIKEKINEEKSKIITANSGKIIRKNQEFILILNEGGITTIDKDKTYTLNFKSTEYSLSKFSTKSVTVQKIQEMNSIQLIKCWHLYNYLFNKETFAFCKKGAKKQTSQELFKRLMMPFYILAISFIASTLVVNFKSDFLLNYKKIFLFIVGILIIIFSQFSIRLIGDIIFKDVIISSLPFVLILFLYLLVIVKNKIYKI